MDSEEYKEKLSEPEWQNKRKQILFRDGYKCVVCGSKTRLQVHHIHYSAYGNPWDVDNSSLETLCKSCHSIKHDPDLDDFY